MQAESQTGLLEIPVSFLTNPGSRYCGHVLHTSIGGCQTERD